MKKALSIVTCLLCLAGCGQETPANKYAHKYAPASSTTSFDQAEPGIAFPSLDFNSYFPEIRTGMQWSYQDKITEGKLNILIKSTRDNRVIASVETGNSQKVIISARELFWNSLAKDIFGMKTTKPVNHTPNCKTLTFDLNDKSCYYQENVPAGTFSARQLVTMNTDTDQLNPGIRTAYSMVDKKVGFISIKVYPDDYILDCPDGHQDSCSMKLPDLANHYVLLSFKAG